MNLAERQRQFADAAQKRFKATKATRISRQFGVSNSAKIIEGGIQIGVPNLDSAGSDVDAFILACVIKFPPEDEVYFAVLIRNDRKNLLQRLDSMKAAGQAAKAAEKSTEDSSVNEILEVDDDTGNIKYSARNNLAATYIARDGKLYLRNARFWDSLNFDLNTVGPGVVPDEIVVSVYPPSISARRSLLAREFIGYLGSLVGRDKVHELNVWAAESALAPAMRRMPQTLSVSDIESSVEKLGGFYPDGEVRRYHGALNFLNHKHFVILSGLSGTGKTQLALQYARAVHGLSSNEVDDPLLFVCPVRPEWTDPSGLTGYFDVLSNRYVVPRFLEAVLIATAHRDAPVFVVLDEMNLARVEYYLSDVLSCIETKSHIQLHSSGVPLEGSTGTSIPAALPLPPNLYITGTINIDESTTPVSDKVLDRAIVIDMSTIDLPGFLAGLENRDPGLTPARATAEPILLPIHAMMQEHRLGFGYRVAEDVVRYLAFAAENLNTAASDILDQLMVQKVLVKLRGADRQRPLLTGLQKTLVDMPRSQELLNRLTADLDEFGSFQATR